jgi:hypothetical protein
VVGLIFFLIDVVVGTEVAVKVDVAGNKSSFFITSVEEEYSRFLTGKVLVTFEPHPAVIIVIVKNKIGKIFLII